MARVHFTEWIDHTMLAGHAECATTFTPLILGSWQVSRLWLIINHNMMSLRMGLGDYPFCGLMPCYSAPAITTTTELTVNVMPLRDVVDHAYAQCQK